MRRRVERLCREKLREKIEHRAHASFADLEWDCFVPDDCCDRAVKETTLNRQEPLFQLIGRKAREQELGGFEKADIIVGYAVRVVLDIRSVVPRAWPDGWIPGIWNDLLVKQERDEFLNEASRMSCCE